MGLFSSNASYLGIDIGSTGIKVVELEKAGNQPKLKTYGFSSHKSARVIDWSKDVAGAAKAINKVLDSCGAQSRSATSALPTFSVFSSVLNLSNVNRKDLAQAVQWEAKKVIPLPLDEMILDWKEIEDKEAAQAGNIKVLLTGAPQTLINQYIEIFKAAEINLLSLETETFSLIRSLIGNDTAAIMMVEIGANTTDVSIVDNKIPMLSRSIDIGGKNMTESLEKKLNMPYEKAEQFKNDLGISEVGNDNPDSVKMVEEALSPIVNEIKFALNLFKSKNAKSVEKIILSGGGVMLPNLPAYMEKVLDMKVIVGDPWARVSYPLELKPLLTQIGTKMAVAIGLALREFE